MHSEGIAHRDLKAENTLFSLNCDLKIADFGLSTTELSSIGTVGSENYMAPELHSYNSHDTRTTDIFSAGVILFVMIAKSFPFSKSSLHCKHFELFINHNETFWTKRI